MRRAGFTPSCSIRAWRWSCAGPCTTKQLVLDPARLEKLIVRLANEWRKATAQGTGDRPADRRESCGGRCGRPLARSLPDLAVIAYQEVPGDLLLEPAALLKLEDLTA